jgi:hypothetical protein
MNAEHKSRLRKLAEAMLAEDSKCGHEWVEGITETHEMRTLVDLLNFTEKCPGLEHWEEILQRDDPAAAVYGVIFDTDDADGADNFWERTLGARHPAAERLKTFVNGIVEAYHEIFDAPAAQAQAA